MTVKACWSVPEDVVDHWLVQVQIWKLCTSRMNSAALALPMGGSTMLLVGGRYPKVLCPILCHSSAYLYQTYGSAVREQIRMCSCAVASAWHLLNV